MTPTRRGRSNGEQWSQSRSHPGERARSGAAAPGPSRRHRPGSMVPDLNGKSSTIKYGNSRDRCSARKQSADRYQQVSGHRLHIQLALPRPKAAHTTTASHTPRTESSRLAEFSRFLWRICRAGVVRYTDVRLRQTGSRSLPQKRSSALCGEGTKQVAGIVYGRSSEHALPQSRCHTAEPQFLVLSMLELSESEVP